MHVVDILTQNECVEKFLIMNFIGKLCLKMLTNFVKTVRNVKKIESLSHRNEMLEIPILFCENFDVWSMNFMGYFPNSFDFLYILLTVDYVSK